jgi:hypothetical protein
MKMKEIENTGTANSEALSGASDAVECCKCDRPSEPDDAYEQWIAKYRPVVNMFDPDASCDGFMFETFGAEGDYVSKWADDRSTEGRVWTLIDGDDGESVIIPGCHWVNRIGYFVTEVPCDDEGMEVPL